MNNIIYLILCLTLISCKENKKRTISSSERISKLNSVEKQTNFLMEIFNKDQQVRKDEKVAIQNFGHNSPQHQTAVQVLMNVDDNNLVLIESYLKQYGHPIKKMHGREAADTPWLVVHHASADKGVRKKYFKLFYDAYKKGDMPGNAMTFYLNRMYNLKFNSQIEWNRPYREEEEIDTLIQSLGLKELIR